MNPFVYPEFWLSLAFIAVIGMVVLPSIRQRGRKFFDQKRQTILDQIQQADTLLKEAKDLFKEVQKNSKIRQDTTELNQKVKSMKKEYAQKTKEQVEVKEQDFQMRSSLMILQIKNHLRTDLLNKAEEKILKVSPQKSLNKDIEHLIQMLNENKEKLKESLG